MFLTYLSTIKIMFFVDIDLTILGKKTLEILSLQFAAVVLERQASLQKYERVRRNSNSILHY